MAEHSPEPWYIENEPHIVWDRFGVSVARAVGPFDDDTPSANARRIVACVNFLKGLTTEEIESSIAARRYVCITDSIEFVTALQAVSLLGEHP
jgi:hypothetical protein